ncbi:TetR family transcriptional regulator [Afifella sp. H1R]|uniref:TetR family transcriptional regulator n=1 Tax=Afifella sp. H1R TaxID=2908841 RepID=UPI001F3D8369|nr:TetR family transcriptional regulator [Afifella sp. H1R]MCF1502526.1 TetR family transcriptional regulator [Afifella sp. H1R]
MATAKTRDKIIDALLDLVAERDWDDVTLADIADAAGVTLQQLREAYDGRGEILGSFCRRTDRVVLSNLDPDMAFESRRERLFDVLFSRFEALGPHKHAVSGLAHSARRDPLLAAELNRHLVTSMAWMMTAAGISSGGPGGLVRAQGLAFLWSRVARTWLTDDDPGLARTMSALDRELRKGERAVMRLDRLARFLPRPPGGRRHTARRSAPAPEAAAPSDGAQAAGANGADGV